MTEALLHYIWKLRLFNEKVLKTKNGEIVYVIQPGQHNLNSGPDFFNAKIKIGNKIWSGNVEIHVDGKEWYQHKHHLDPAYKNVILHVVLHSEKTWFECFENTSIPCIELRGRVSENLLARYELLMKNSLPFPCAKMVSAVDNFTRKNMLEKAAIERLQTKTKHIQIALKPTQNNWEQVCWQMMARYLGSGINGDALEQTAKKISINTLAKYNNQTLQIEAIVFGVAGLLQQDFVDDYPKALKREFNYLKRLHNLEVLNEGVFKWAKTRPANFPTLRLAQLAAIANFSTKLFSNVLENDMAFIKQLAANTIVNRYWKTHFRFDEQAANKFTKIGAATAQTLVINTVVPLLFAYGKHIGNESLCDKALETLRQQKAEANAIVRLFNGFSFNIENALETQGAIELKNSYCEKKNCLRCGIGNAVLKS